MRFLKTSEAAALLNVSPNTLRAWERRFGYPKPQRSPGRHRLYTHGEVAALRDALQEGLSISSAVSRAREGLSGDHEALVAVLAGFERERADAALEAALALRSLERSVEEVLLPALVEISERSGLDSAQWAFAARWGSDWLRRAQRLAPPPVRPVSILVGDATRDELDPDAPHLRALELLCVRGGARVMSLSVRGVTGMPEAVAAARPDAVVLAGAHARDDEVARWAYAVRSAAGPLTVTLFRRNLRSARVRTTGARALSSTPSGAQRELLDLVEAARPAERRPRRDRGQAPPAATGLEAGA